MSAIVAAGYGAIDKVTKAGDNMTGTLVLTASTPLQITSTSPGAGKVLVSDASGNASWGTGVVSAPLTLSSGQASSSILQVTNTTSAPTVAALRVTSAAAGDRSVALDVSGDTQRRLLIDSNGKIQWGPGGSTAPDTDLYRSGAAALTTDGALTVGATLGVTGAATLSSTLAVTSTSTLTGLLTANGGVTVSGATQLSQATATGPVLKVTDTTSAPTNPVVQVIANAAADNTLGLQVTGDTKLRLLVDSNGKMQWGPGGSTAGDTNLYRNAASELKTDQSLTVASSLTVGGAQLLGGGVGVLGINNAGTKPSSNPASGIILYGDSTTGTPLKARDTGGSIWGILPILKVKTSNQSVTNSTTLTNDTALSASVEANATYIVKLVWTFDGPASNSMADSWALPTGATFVWNSGYQTLSGVATDSWATNGVGSLSASWYDAYLKTSSAGTLQWKWAQTVASTTATTVYANSYLMLWRVA